MAIEGRRTPTMTNDDLEDFQEDGPELGFFAERLNRLFKSVHPQDRAPYSTPEAAKLINEAAGQSVISPTYLWQLRKGKRTDPTLSRVAAIARLFNVKLDYFNEAKRQEPSRTELQLAQALQKQPIRELARQADGLSAVGVAALLDLARSLRRIEGLHGSEDED
ncbi:XRE family transcriptional regulator [Streptacidiphilus sp. MAP5-3]|uniref:XRE family transcriptional regulator n=1 Tax=unclassified Streptacidiphilus TaxID=2643834 RepID=UPI003518EAB0